MIFTGRPVIIASFATAISRRGDHANARGRQLQDFGERAMDVMGRLRRGPQCELAIRRPACHSGVLLHRQVSVAFEEEQIFPHEIRFANGRLDVAELEVDQLVQIAAVGVVVNPRLGMRHGGFGRVEGFERLVDDPDEIEGGGRCLFSGRRHGCDGIADEADFIHAQRVLVLRDGQNPERNRQIAAREHCLHAVQLLRRGYVDRHDARVRLGAAQQPAIQHPGERQIVGEARSARHFRNGVDLPQRLSDDSMLGHTAFPVSARLFRPACAPPPAPPPHRS